MKKIPLTNSVHQAKVDDVDYDYVSQFEWYETQAGYACRFTSSGHIVYMHDEIWVRRSGGVAPVRSAVIDPVLNA